MKMPSPEAIRLLQRWACGSALLSTFLAACWLNPRLTILSKNPSQGPTHDSRIMDFSTLDPSALIEDWTLASFEPDVDSTTADLPGISSSYSPFTP